MERMSSRSVGVQASKQGAFSQAEESLDDRMEDHCDDSTADEGHELDADCGTGEVDSCQDFVKDEVLSDEENSAAGWDRFPGAVTQLDEDAEQDLKDAVEAGQLHAETQMSGAKASSLVMPAGVVGEPSESASDCATTHLPKSVTFPRCFLSRTTFELLQGGFITAAELVKGNVVKGPHEKHLKVLNTKRLHGTEQDIISFAFTTKSSDTYQFEVTSLHRIQVESGDALSTVHAKDFVELVKPGVQPSVLTGDLSYRKVHKVNTSRRLVEVVEVTFDEDLEVLAWLPPKRAPKGKQRHFKLEAAVACLGQRSIDQDLRSRCAQRNTFVEVLEQYDLAPMSRTQSWP